MQLAGLQPFLADAADDGREQAGGLAGPTRERRAVDVDTLRRHHLGLAVERQMMVELGDHDMGERRETRFALGNGLRLRRRLHDLLAGPAAIFGPHRSDDAPLDGEQVEHLVAVLAERAQRPAASRAGTVSSLGFNPTLGARQMGRQAANRCWALAADGFRLGDIRDGGFAFQLFQCQLELLDLAGELLGRLPEVHPAQLG